MKFASYEDDMRLYCMYTVPVWILQDVCDKKGRGNVLGEGQRQVLLIGKTTVDSVLGVGADGCPAVLVVEGGEQLLSKSAKLISPLFTQNLQLETKKKFLQITQKITNLKLSYQKHCNF